MVDDYEIVEKLLGRKPQGKFSVVVRRADNDGSPVVIENSPIMDSGQPMPTLFWLIDPVLVKLIGTIESKGGVKEAERSLSEFDIKQVHSEYENLRNSKFNKEQSIHSPDGGVGGTRRGVKCLHAHYANYLVNGSDPIGIWTHNKLILEDNVPSWEWYLRELA